MRAGGRKAPRFCMAQIIDTNPDTGLQTLLDYDPVTDKFSVGYKQDLSGFLSALQERRNKEDSAAGIKENWWHYCSIPEIVQLELHAKGIDVLNPAHSKRVFDEINANYPYLKLTNKTHRVAHE